MAVNYVRFLRGTPAGFNSLSVKDNNTLYFISEVDSASGKLYLGNKLISGNSSSQEITPTNIADLADVIIEETQAGSILVKDNDGKWHSKTPQEVAAYIGASLMVGASEEADGTSGLVPAPKKNEKNLFLRGDATWEDPTSDLKTTINKLVGTDTTKTVRQIVTEELTSALVSEDASDNLSTLQEIADWIQAHPQDASQMNTKIISLEEALNGKNDGTVGLISKVGTLESNFNNLKAVVQGEDNQSGLVKTVGDLNTLISNHTTEINEIKERLTWHELQDNGQEL